MLTSCTSSEEEMNPYLWKFTQNIRKNNEGTKLLKIPLTSMRVGRFASYENIVTRFQISSILLLSHPPDWLLNSLKEPPLQPVLKSFVKAFIQNNEGLENKLNRTPLLGSAKSFFLLFNSVYDCMKTLRQVFLESMKCSSTM